MSVRPRHTQGGAVLLLALLAVALIMVLLASVLSRQSKLIHIESAERERQQAMWLMQGAMDWARLILREDARSGTADHLSEPWAVPLQESRLSGFLATQSGAREASKPLDEEVVLSGGIEDAQGRFNLTNLLQGQQIDTQARAQLARLFGLLGLPADRAEDLARTMVQSRQPGAKWLPLRTPDDLAAWGWEQGQIDRLQAHVVILPERTRINVNTASPEVMAATVDGLSLANAERLALARLRAPWTQQGQAQVALGAAFDSNRHDIGSRYFLLRGRLRLGRTELSQTALVKRDGPAVVYRWVMPHATTARP